MVSSNCQTSASGDVLLSSPWIPAEWVKAHGFEPRAIPFMAGFGAAPLPLGEGVCAFAQSALRIAEQSNRPAVVFATHCDQLRRAFDTGGAARSTRTFLFNIPATSQTSVGGKLFYAELERLGKFLIQLGGVLPSAERVAQQVAHYHGARRRLRDVANLSAGREYARAVARFHWDASLDLPHPVSPDEGKTTRLAVVGGPLSPDDSLWDQIEAVGACVVLNATEWGERSLGCATAGSAAGEHLASPIFPLALLSRQFAEGCVDVFQRPNQRLYDWLAERLRARHVQGIVLWSHFGCDLWRAEAQTLREKFGMPLLWIEADEAGSGEERQAGRIQAFVEALK